MDFVKKQCFGGALQLKRECHKVFFLTVNTYSLIVLKLWTEKKIAPDNVMLKKGKKKLLCLSENVANFSNYFSAFKDYKKSYHTDFICDKCIQLFSLHILLIFTESINVFCVHYFLTYLISSFDLLFCLLCS